MGIANLAGVPATHQPFHQATLYAISVAANAVIVQGLKRLPELLGPMAGHMPSLQAIPPMHL